ncbi:recombinase family protein [Paracraurococcus lichenis]|uniref:Recombinase family protein n=1 Tax=Paracraurococcus lichenis TaxID=3064888 RepID=A0ABT9ECE8_9PROT|nr:recombinase family protein [Paracraurococcus sp. LOR1-02]MDO9713889.1 recombinase family protein [Paracraurococcus sp. LOR1-02]
MAGRKVKQAASAEAPAARGAVVGYARTSTVEQEAGLEAQRRDLAATGCGRVFAEQASSIGKRDQLAAALDYLREGDVLVVTKPDRLARSVADLLGTVAKLEAKGVSLRVLSMGGQSLDTSTPTGKLMLTVLGGVAEFERALMLERQREGIAKAKGEGKYKGRKPTARAKADDVQRLRAAGMTPTDIATKLGIGRASVYRVLQIANGNAASCPSSGPR